jgi:F-type H+-transporting ATPase subunit gamma
VPRFTELQLYQAMLESQASEHSARMVAMRNASENASQLVGDLTLEYTQGAPGGYHRRDSRHRRRHGGASGIG